MELIIDLNKEAVHDKGLSYYDHNYYKLKVPLFGMDYVKVEYYECHNNWSATLGKCKECFVGEYFYDAHEDKDGLLTIYID